MDIKGLPWIKGNHGKRVTMDKGLPLINGYHACKGVTMDKGLP